MAPQVHPHPEARPTAERIGTVDTTEFSVTERVISSAGDPFVGASKPLAEMLPSERERLIREHYAPEYREHLRRIVAAGVTDDEEEE
jgi:hypothetical protein